MASLLVYVDPARVAGLSPGASWTILPDDIRDVAYLDERSSLFVVTVEAGRARVVAVHDGVIETGGSDARVFDHDITAIVPRLGCGTVEDLMTWTTPRIVTPGDVVLLRYTLGLPVDDPEPPDLGLVLRDDPRADELRAAVWEDLAADGPRLVYADYLATRGDPRGELINLQLARARYGGPVTTREERLLRSYALECVDELRPYLRPQVELARGFVVRCVTRADVPIPPHMIDHPAWSTVEDLGTSRVELAQSRRLVSARTLRIHGHELTSLVESKQVLPYETVLGWSDHGENQPGVYIDEVSWTALCRRGALDRLRALSLNGVLNIPFERFGATPLGQTLEQLDVYTRLGGHQAIALRDMFERCELPLLTIRVPLGGEPRVDACLALARGEHGTRLAVQLERPLDAPRVTELLRRIAPLSTGLRRVVVEDIRDPANIAERQRELIARLAPMFRDIVARPVPIERLGL